MAVYFLISFSKERNLINKVSENIEKYNETYKKRLLKLRYTQYYKANKKGKRILTYMDILIEKANIRKYITVLSAELVLILCFSVSLAAFTITFKILYNPISAIILAVVSFSLPIYILKIVAYRNASNIDKNLVNYTSILKNFCFIKDDIFFAIDRSIPYLDEPLKTYNIALINEIKHGIPVYDALENLKRKVENKQFKILIKNLQLCTKHKGSYTNVLTKSNDVLTKYSIERARRTKEIKKQRLTIYIMLFIMISTIKALIVINPALELQLRTNFIGQMVVVYNILAILFAIYKSFTLEQLEY